MSAVDFSSVWSSLDGPNEEYKLTVLKVAMSSAIAAVALSLLGIVFAIVFFTSESDVFTAENTDEYDSLDTDTLVQIWEVRLAAESTAELWGVFGSLAWLAVIPVFQILSQIYRHRAGATYMYQLIALGAVMNFINFSNTMGSFTGAEKLEATLDIFNTTKHSNNGGFGAIQALEIMFRWATYSTTWAFAIDYVLLGGGFAILAYISYTDGTPLPTKCNTAASGIMAICCLLSFVFDVGGLTSSVLGQVGGFFTVIFDLTYIVWLIVAAVAFSKVITAGPGESKSSDRTTTVVQSVELSEVEVAEEHV